MKTVTDKTRCNNCYEVFPEDQVECPNCKTDAYLMQPFMQEIKPDIEYKGYYLHVDTHINRITVFVSGEDYAFTTEDGAKHFIDYLISGE